MNFSTVWQRIQNETKMESISQLAEIVGKRHQTVSARKRQGRDFPIEWAYFVAKKYNLSIDWILTGKGNKSPEAKPTAENEYILLLEKWLNTLKAEDPRKEYWFQCSMEKKFPEFKEWIVKNSQKIKE